MTSQQVEAVWVFRFEMSHFKALYGRRVSGASEHGYTKDHLQVHGNCPEIFAMVIGHQLNEGEEYDLILRWPGGETNAKLFWSGGREVLRWDAGHAPAPWLMAPTLSRISLETFEGNPNLQTAEAANDEWARFSSLGQEPWLLLVKLRGEADVLHVRAYLRRPPPHLSHCATELLPSRIRSLMGEERSSCRAVYFPKAEELGQETDELWFDPERNHDAFVERDHIALPEIFDLSPSEVFTPFDADEEASIVHGDFAIPSPHDVNAEIAILESRLEEEPQLTEGLPPAKRIQAVRPRDAAFRRSVRRAYAGKCAICGSSLHDPKGRPEVEAAHIYPKSRDGRDDVRNGIALCRRHHWAFDTGWLSISDQLTVLVHPSLPESEEFEFIREHDGSSIRLPLKARMNPHPIYLSQHRALHGFMSSLDSEA